MRHLKDRRENAVYNETDNDSNNDNNDGCDQR